MLVGVDQEILSPLFNFDRICIIPEANLINQMGSDFSSAAITNMNRTTHQVCFVDIKTDFFEVIAFLKVTEYSRGLVIQSRKGNTEKSQSAQHDNT